MTKTRLYDIVFKTDSKAGKQFDIVLLWVILLSVVVVMLESVPAFGSKFKSFFTVVEWVFTIVFTIEYLLRIAISPRPFKYVFSFWGFIDLLSILPSFLSLVFVGYHYFLVIRIFRLLRVFRVFKMARFNSETIVLIQALKASSYKISVFMLTVIAIVSIMGTLMYVVEGDADGFSSIPQSIYWAIVTITTVGYGDIVPLTVLGKIMSSVIMIMGYAIIAVPTGIVTVEMSKSSRNNLKCPNCNHKNENTALYCNQCGEKLN